MISKPALRAVVGALACVLCGVATAQGRYQSHGGEMRAGAPMGRGPYERGGPGMGRGVYERPGPPTGRGPGAPGGYPAYPPPYAAPPRYASPPPRRTYEAPPGWRAAPRQPPGIGGPRPPGAMDAPRMASLGWVIETIRQRSPGRQLDADVAFMDGRPVYRVRWLTVHGRRMDYYVDAETGVILSGR